MLGEHAEVQRQRLGVLENHLARCGRRVEDLRRSAYRVVYGSCLRYERQCVLSHHGRRPFVSGKTLVVCRSR